MKLPTFIVNTALNVLTSAILGYATFIGAQHIIEDGYECQGSQIGILSVFFICFLHSIKNLENNYREYSEEDEALEGKDEIEESKIEEDFIKEPLQIKGEIESSEIEAI